MMRYGHKARSALAAIVIVAATTSCGAVPSNSDAGTPSLLEDVPAAKTSYEPLASGNSWTYLCNHDFTIVDQIVGTLQVDGKLVYVMSLQIPTSPQKSVFVRQLLANDRLGNTWIYGYYLHHRIVKRTPTKIVVINPVLHAHYDYPAPTHGTVERVFVGFEYTNPTPLGTFWVAPYFESSATHNYGYSKGRGVMEEDHGPNYEYDCLIEKYVLH